MVSDMGYVIVGAPIHRAGAYVIDKFLENQREIQSKYPSSELVLATIEKDFIEELKRTLKLRGIRGSVIPYESVKPDYALSTVWNTSCGGERRYAKMLFLGQRLVTFCY